MIQPVLLHRMFCTSYNQIRRHTAGTSHAQSVRAPLLGPNPTHWIVGHVVVARCNFMMLLGVQSIWDWPTCERFIPGSTPSAETGESIAFKQLLTDLDRSQEQLEAALTRVSAAELDAVRDSQTIGEYLAEYAMHEAYHAEQLELLCQGLGSRN